MDLTLHLTHRCNLRCRYCYAGDGGAPAARDMSEDVIDAAIALAVAEAIAKRPFVTLTFFGGEPLLRRDLIEYGLAQLNKRCEAADIDYSARICSNGLLLDSQALDFIERHGLSLALSIDGIKAAHDAHRVFEDGRGSHAAIAKKLPDVLARLPYTSVQMVITPQTACYLPDSVTFLLDLGVRYILSTLDYTAGWDEVSMGQLKDAYAAVAELYQTRTLDEQKFYLACLDAKISSHAKGPISRQERCEAGRSQISVAPSGRIYPCVQFVGEDKDHRYALGHVLEGGFDRACRQRFFARSERKKHSCSQCALEKRCNNWCACLNWQTTGDVDRVSPLLCTHERLLLETADRAAETLYEKRAPMFLRKHYDDAHPFLSYLEDVARNEKG